MKRATPYVMFPGNALEAFTFYHRVFGGEAPEIVRYRDMGTTGEDADLVAHVSLAFGDEVALMGSDVSGKYLADHRVGTNVEIHLTAEDADEARRVFEMLAEGGSVSMPLEKVAWSELFGSCVDRFGVRWMVDYAGDVQLGAS
jgi:PhnB protein